MDPNPYLDFALEGGMNFGISLKLGKLALAIHRNQTADKSKTRS
jgi:hypothetical protein